MITRANSPRAFIIDRSLDQKPLELNLAFLQRCSSAGVSACEFTQRLAAPLVSITHLCLQPGTLQFATFETTIRAVEVIMSVETVLVTGASSGIGRELAKAFAADGCRLILVARKRNALQELADELRRAHQTQSEVLTTDLAQPSAPFRIFEHLQANGTRVEVLINNAGFGAHGQFAELPLDRQLEMIQVNITSLTHLTRLLLPGILERHRGGVLNVASTAGFQPGPRMAVYYATKAFVLSFSEAIAEEVVGTGITVTALCPGPTATNFAEAAGARFSRLFLRNALSAEAVAGCGHRAFRAGKIVAICGLRNQLLTFSERLAPRALVRKIVKALNASTYKS